MRKSKWNRLVEWFSPLIATQAKYVEENETQGVFAYCFNDIINIVSPG